MFIRCHIFYLKEQSNIIYSPKANIVLIYYKSKDNPALMYEIPAKEYEIDK